MRILHIYESLAGGGIESMICGLSNEMAKHEDVTVCSVFEPKKSDVFWNKLTPQVKKITVGKINPGFSLKVLIQIVNLIKKGKFDIVNLHGMFFYYALAVIILRNKTNFFYTIHSDAWMENAGWDKRFFLLKKICFQRGYMNPITISRVSQNSFRKLYQCNSSLIYNGIPLPLLTSADLTKSYRFTQETKVFIHAGRIHLAKNQLLLCKVFSRLIYENYDIVLLIAGSNQDKNIFQSLVPYFSNRIQYLGERSDIPQLMSSCDAMCLPSLWEGMPVSLLEALSVGCIPICSNVGGIPNVINNGVNGFLSLSASEDEYYTTMTEYLSKNKNELDKIKKNCIDSFNEYDIVNTSQTYIEAYKTNMNA